MKRILLIFSIFASALASSFAAATGAARTVLDELNLARTKPSDYASTRLEPLLSGDNTSYQKALAECVREMNSMEALPPLVWADGLALTADESVKSLVAGTDCPELPDRLGSSCNWRTCSESVVTGQSVPRSMVIKLLVDSDSASRANRKSVLTPEYTHVGLSMASHKDLAFVCSLDFATGFFQLDPASQRNLTTKNGAKSLVAEINYARTKPRDYVKNRLVPLYAGGKSDYQKALGNLIDEMNGMVAVNPLVFSDELYSSAKDFTDSLISENEVPDSSSDSSSDSASDADMDGMETDEHEDEHENEESEEAPLESWEERLRKYRGFGTVAESVSFGTKSVQSYVADFLIDEGVDGFVNRRNLLSSDFTHAGANVGETEGDFVCCVDLGTWYDVNTVPTEAFDLLSDRAPKQLLTEINFARTDPAEYVRTRLEPLLTEEDDGYQKALRELIKKMLGMPAQEPLIYVRTLENAAREWVRSQSSTAETSYDGEWETRIGKYCMWNGGSESLYFGPASPEKVVEEMLIDAENPSRSRRENILSRIYTHMGAATGVHAKYEGICLIEFVGGYLDFPENALKSPNTRLGKGISQAEQTVISEINFARTEPQRYVTERLEPLVKNEVSTYQSALIELISEMNKMEGVGKLEFRADLHNAADEWVRESCADGIIGYADDWSDRLSKVCKWKICSQNNSYGAFTAKDIVLQLLIDATVPDRGHRRNLLDPAMNAAGDAIGEHPAYGIMCCINLISQ